MGPWSAPFEFTTEQLPPPTIRSAPSVTEVAAGCFQVEWSPLRSVSPSAKEPIFYRLQLAPRTSSSKSSGYWKTVLFFKLYSFWSKNMSSELFVPLFVSPDVFGIRNLPEEKRGYRGVIEIWFLDQLKSSRGMVTMNWNRRMEEGICSRMVGMRGGGGRRREKNCCSCEA